MGLLDPDTSDGRVIFFLPWQNQTIAGTTDSACEVTHSPRPTEDEIAFILGEVKNYLNPDVEGKGVWRSLSRARTVKLHTLNLALSWGRPKLPTDPLYAAGPSVQAASI